MSFRFYPITPIAKPRMTGADAITLKKLRARRRLNDKERKRAPILSAWLAFVDECKLRKVQIEESDCHVVFVMPMPASWTKTRRDEMRGQPHRGKKDKARKNDVDNLAKALLDAVYGEDSGVWDIRSTKIWSDCGGIFVAHQAEWQLTIPLDVETWANFAKRGGLTVVPVVGQLAGAIQRSLQ